MRTRLELTRLQYHEIWGHLLPPGATQESAAFLFTDFIDEDGVGVFRIKDIFYAEKFHFDHQYEDYLELADETRQLLIKKAHGLQASLIEMHSHPFPGIGAAAFSWSDRRGLTETVPHMRWRLKNKPYGAIVVAPEGFDALVWIDNPAVPLPLEGINVGGELLKPTNRSLGGWNEKERYAI